MLGLSKEIGMLFEDFVEKVRNDSGYLVRTLILMIVFVSLIIFWISSV